MRKPSSCRATASTHPQTVIRSASCAISTGRSTQRCRGTERDDARPWPNRGTSTNTFPRHLRDMANLEGLKIALTNRDLWRPHGTTRRPFCKDLSSMVLLGVILGVSLVGSGSDAG